MTEYAQLLYNIVLISAKQQSESALSIHMPTPSWTSLLSLPTIPYPKKQILITILEMIIYTLLCVYVCVCVCVCVYTFLVAQTV